MAKWRKQINYYLQSNHQLTINCLTSMIFIPQSISYISGLKHLTQYSIGYLCILFTLNIMSNNSFYKDMA